MRPLPEKPDEYWKLATPAVIGDQASDQLYSNVGRCLTHYEQIEESCAMLFSLLVDADTEAAYRAYGCIIANSTKSEMLKNAAEIFFSEHSVVGVHRDTFDLLMKHYQKASERRNEIAHGSVIGFIGNDKNLHFYLVPGVYNARKTGSVTTTQVPPLPTSSVAFRRAKYHYIASELEYFGHRFIDFRSYLDEYRDLLNTKYPKRT